MKRAKILSSLMMISLLMPISGLGQNANINSQQSNSTIGEIEYGNRELPQFVEEVISQTDEPAAKDLASAVSAIVTQLKSSNGKNPVLIDDNGYAKDLILQDLAIRLGSDISGKRLYRVNWRSLFSESSTAEDVVAKLNATVAYFEKNADKAVLVLDDVNSFSGHAPLLGQTAADILSNKISRREIKVYTAGTSADFEKLASVSTFKKSFAKIDLLETQKDPFVGDKISPDLKHEVATRSGSETVKVLLQADDIADGSLTRMLSRLNVTVSKRSEVLKTLVTVMPLGAVEEIAKEGNVKHLSLDRQVRLLGHLEDTTGTTLVRTIQQGVSVGLLGIGVVNTSSLLDGTGIGIAVLDSGISEDHRMFVNKAGAKRVVKTMSFAEGNAKLDKFGHGSHVASLISANSGQNLNVADGLYISNYQGIAPNADIINIKVLNDEGIGSTETLISALDWVLANRAANNIRVVNLSLGTAAVETWRNDPICRAVRRLTAAGIVLVAAAGNHGKLPDGQKIYGAIHAPGNDPSVITVGAANTFGTDERSDDGIATYSSRGPTRSYWTDDTGGRHYDHLIKPDLVAPGNLLLGARAKDNALVSDHEELEGGSPYADDRRKLMYLSGTSMAAPVVSGTVALLLQTNSKLTPNMVKMILQYTSQPLAGFNTLEQGTGLLNVEGAVRLTRAIRTDLPSSPSHGASMLKNNQIPDHFSTISGTRFQWSGGIAPNYAVVSGVDLIKKYQRVYDNGLLISDGLLLSDGLLISDGLLLSDGLLISDGLLLSDGTILGANQQPSGYAAITNGNSFAPSGLLLSDNFFIADGSTIGDGLLLSDGLLISDGLLLSDSVFGSRAQINGDQTTKMR